MTLSSGGPGRAAGATDREGESTADMAPAYRRWRTGAKPRRTL